MGVGGRWCARAAAPLAVSSLMKVVWVLFAARDYTHWANEAAVGYLLIKEDQYGHQDAVGQHGQLERPRLRHHEPNPRRQQRRSATGCAAQRWRPP